MEPRVRQTLTRVPQHHGDSLTCFMKVGCTPRFPCFKVGSCKWLRFHVRTLGDSGHEI